MTTSKLKSALLIAAVVPFLMACPKPSKNMAPVPDQELQSSIDISFANLMVTDIDMICSFVAENDLYPDFYLPSPISTATVISVRDVSADQLAISFNNTDCIDGHTRSGSIFLYYGNTNPSAKYYRDFDFKGRVVLNSYKVDGWSINTVAGTECYLYNQLRSSVYDPSTTKLSWLIDGSFEFIHESDPSKNMVWKGKLIKTLANTSDPQVFDKSKQNGIKWALAKVEYRGEATGYTSGNVPFEMKIEELRPLTRDFTCYPDAMSGVTSLQPLKTWAKESHPFKNGMVYFTTGEKYQRQIFYGNEGDTRLENQCDHTGQVLIKGNTYKINFMN